MRIQTTVHVLFALTLLLWLTPLGLVYSQAEDQFEVSQAITEGGDVDAPSVPTSLTATAISTSEIDLSWTASTDNIGVTGYQVFRDSVQIATSTVTSFSDTGLSPSTAYVYTVTAFDAADNISAQSASASATTLGEDGGISGGRTAPRIFGVEAFPDTNSALILWRTTRSAKTMFFWGATPDYELGTLSEVIRDDGHSTELNGLTSSTRYYFKIIVDDNRVSGFRDTFEGIFETLSLPDTEPPASVTNFTGIGFEDRIELSWSNPTDDDFELVRVVRSNHFFPGGPFDGAVIYEGSGEAVTDTTALPDITYFYSAFARDEAGNYAAPAVTQATRVEPGEEPRVVTDPFELFTQAIDVHPIIQALSLADFDFFQNGIEIKHVGDIIPVDGGEILGVAIDYDKLPEILKTIGLTLTDPDDVSKSFSFLLRVNEEKTRYLAAIAPLLRGGNYRLDITILDFNNQAQKRLDGSLDVTDSPEPVDIPNTLKTLLFWLLLLSLLLFLLLLDKKRKKKEEEENDTTTIDNK